MRGMILFLLFVSASVSSTWAAPAYGTKMPAKGKLFGGLQAYYVAKRELESPHGKVRSMQEFVLLSYGVTDWFSIDLKGGAGNIRQRPEIGHDINYPTYLGGGYGFRIKLLDRNETKVVTGFQHISIHPFSKSVGPSKHKAVLDDWQFSLLGSHTIAGWNPYVGTRWSWLNEIHWIDTQRNLQKSTLGKSVGLIAGLDIPLTGKTWINVEAQFFDSTAVSASLNFSF